MTGPKTSIPRLCSVVSSRVSRNGCVVPIHMSTVSHKRGLCMRPCRDEKEEYTALGHGPLALCIFKYNHRQAQLHPNDLLTLMRTFSSTLVAP